MDDKKSVKRKVILPDKRPSSVTKFCRKIRLARCNCCENCDVGVEVQQIESHHILPYHEYPELGEDEGNILVLCQTCHRGLTPPYGQIMHGELINWARLRPALRERIADYVEVHAPTRTTFIQIVRAGEEAAERYCFKNL